MFCPKCGKENTDGSAFCAGCGANLTVGTAPTATATPSTPKPNATGKLLYTARHTAWQYRKGIVISALLFLVLVIFGISLFTADSPTGGIVFIVLGVISALYIVLAIVASKKNEVLIFDNKIVVKSGILNTKEAQSVLTPVTGVSVSQSLNGKIWNYGNVTIDKIGKGWDINTSYIKHPKALKSFLDELMNSTDYSKINTYMGN